MVSFFISYNQFQKCLKTFSIFYEIDNKSLEFNKENCKQIQIFEKKSILSSICKGKKLLGNRVPANRKHCQFLLEMIFVGA